MTRRRLLILLLAVVATGTAPATSQSLNQLKEGARGFLCQCCNQK